MKKYIFIISTLAVLNFSQSCSESELDLKGNNIVNIEDPRSEQQLQLLLNGAYLQLSDVSGYGAEVMIFGDLLGDKLHTFNTIFSTTANKNFNSNQGEFNFYSLMYNVIMKCNLVINDTNVPMNTNLTRMKAEAKILRGFAYFTLVNYYSPSPTSGVNQEYGVPIVLGNYDSLLQQPRATVAEVYNQIISDLTDGMNNTFDESKNNLGKSAAKLLLAKVYLTRRSPGDAELALQYASDVVNSGVTLPRTSYASYFTNSSDVNSEGQAETIFELDQNKLSNQVTGIGANGALPVYYDVQGGGSDGSRKCLNFMASFYASFRSTDVRRSLLSLNGGSPDNPKGYWTKKYPVKTIDKDGVSSSYTRNIKVLRYSDAQLSRIEALNLVGQKSLALTELNNFSNNRGGNVYTGADLLNDILTERSKEFFGEGQRFLDLKRYNLPIVKTTNCIMNCDVQPGDKLYVLPLTQGNLNSNSKVKQYPGYN